MKNDREAFHALNLPKHVEKKVKSKRKAILFPFPQGKFGSIFPPLHPGRYFVLRYNKKMYLYNSVYTIEITSILEHLEKVFDKIKLEPTSIPIITWIKKENVPLQKLMDFYPELKSEEGKAKLLRIKLLL